METTTATPAPVYDLVVIGSGPGGYIAAIRAAQLGFKVACIEKDKTLGGTCLNVGCIPSKALLESSELYHEATHSFATHGIGVGEVQLDLGKMMARKDRVVKSLTAGVAQLFKKSGIREVHGLGKIETATGDIKTVSVTGADGSQELLQTRKILVATGSSVVMPRFIPFDGERIVSSTEALAFAQVPKHLVIIGAGVIGLELGSVWNRLGAEVTLIELLPRVLNGFDDGLAAEARKVFTRQGLRFELGAKVTAAQVDSATGEVTVSLTKADGSEATLHCDRLLVCVGRKPNTEGLGAVEAGLVLDKLGRIEINDHFETAVPGIYAIGDVVRGAMLAHKAEEEGVACAEVMAGKPGHVNYHAIPNVVYTWPEIASVGYTEEELKEKGLEFKKGSFPFMANGRAKAMNATDGFVKILADAKTDRILGAHIIGPRAGDLIAELAVAVEFGASAEDIARSSHAHPTLAEVVKEAALAVDGRQLNL